MKQEDELRKHIAEVIMRGVSYSGQISTLVIHGAVVEIERVVEAAFLAGRSKTSWKQFKKDLKYLDELNEKT